MIPKVLKESPGRHRRRAGIALVYTLCIISCCAAFCSLAVDYGVVQLARIELRSAADAAARAAAARLPEGVTAVQDQAINTASANSCLGSPVALDRDLDIEFLSYDPFRNTCTTLTGSSRSQANAVKVTARRVRSRGTAVPLSLTSLMGFNSCDVQTSAVATAADYGYGLVGLDWVRLGGNSTASYWSTTGNQGQRGSIASNGDITLSGNTMVHGDARPGPGRTVYGGATHVTGSIAPLSAPLNFPLVDADRFANNNDNGRLPAGTLNESRDLVLKAGDLLLLPGGTYYVHSLYVSSGAVLRFQGPTTLCIYGEISMNGQAVTSGNLPGNLRVVVAGSGNVGLGGSSALYASIYAPQSEVSLYGSGAVYGSVLGKTVNLSGGSDIFYDLALAASGGIKLVR